MPASDARAYLFSLEWIGIKLGLEQIRALFTALDHPERAFPSIIVAGTNGKGSVSAMLERGLRAAGYRTGRYTSPHLVDLEERFAVEGQAIPRNDLDAVIARVHDAAAALTHPPSFFEATTAVALEWFRDARVEIAVLEVGLGGRLDATNAVTPVAAAITAIDFDHQAYLGSTLAEIAREKAGVIKPGMLVVLSHNSPVAEAIVRESAVRAGAHLIRADDARVDRAEMVDGGRLRLDVSTPRGSYGDLRMGLRGRHQIQNAVTAIRLLEELPGFSRFSVSEAAIRTAVEDVVWPARLELVRRPAGDLLLDGAHNPAGARTLAAYVAEAYGRKLPMVVGIMGDKDVAAILEALAPAAAAFVFTRASNERAAAPDTLALAASAVAPEVPCVVLPAPADAVRHATRLGAPVVVAGSLYLAGDIRALDQ